MPIVDIVALLIFAVCISGSLLLQVVAFVKTRRTAGELLYREPWSAFRLDFLTAVAVAVFPISTIDWLMLGQLPWGTLRESTMLLLSAWIVVMWWTGPNRRVELRTRGVVGGYELIPWEKIREYAWVGQRSTLRVESSEEYLEGPVSPQNRAAVEAILEEHRIPPRMLAEAMHAGSGV